MPRKKVPNVPAAPYNGTGKPPASGTAAAEPGREDPVVDQAEIESYDLPKSIVARLSKAACPPGVTMQKDVPIAMIKGSTVFVNYLAALAHDCATEQKHKSISAAHVIDAVRDLGWDDQAELTRMLKRELHEYRKEQELKKDPTKPKGDVRMADVAAAVQKSRLSPPENPQNPQNPQNLQSPQNPTIPAGQVDFDPPSEEEPYNEDEEEDVPDEDEEEDRGQEEDGGAMSEDE